MTGPKNSIVEGDCGGTNGNIWVFGPIGALLVLMTRRWRKRPEKTPH